MKTQAKNLPIVIGWLTLYFVCICIAADMLYNAEITNKDLYLAFQCLLSGGVGGGLYLLRATYLNYCVQDNWVNRWALWYFMRPFASMICGVISMIFLKAGLLVLNADSETDVTAYGFIAFAFIAGLNVDNFIKKLEELAEVSWGISKSRAGKSDTATADTATVTPARNSSEFDILPLEEQYEIAQAWIDENAATYKLQFPEITGIQASKKVVDGDALETVSVTFQVAKKDNVAKPLPAVIEYNNYKIPIDIQQAGVATPHAAIDSGVSRQNDNAYGTLGTPVTKEGQLYFMSCYHVYCNVELANQKFEILPGMNNELISPCYKDLKGNNPTVVGNITEGCLTDFLDVALMKPTTQIDKLYTGVPDVTYYRTLTRDQEGKIYLRFKGHGSSRFCKGILRNIFTNQYIDYTGKSQHYLRGLIAIDRCAADGDSGAVVCDLAGNYVGYVVASDDKYTYIISAYTIEDKAKYKFT